MRTGVYIGTVLGTLCLIGVLFATGAPQEAALAGLACAFCIIPYVLFRVGEAEKQEARHRELLEALRRLDRDT